MALEEVGKILIRIKGEFVPGTGNSCWEIISHGRGFWACTSCMLVLGLCPVSIDPLSNSYG